MLKFISQGCNHCLKYSTKTHRLLNKETANFVHNQQSRDLIGPADPISNLRHIKFCQSKNETYLEKRYREAKEDTQRWNQAFWVKHNTNFIKERERFQEMMRAQGKEILTADDMSVFYKQFLDKNWQSHFNYNISWYKRNIKIAFLEMIVKICKIRYK